MKTQEKFVRETYHKWTRSTPKKWLGDSGNPFSEESIENNK
jgi:hypothetical protein